jgi:transposase
MNYNQNEKIKQITQETLVVGIDIAKHKHVARAQDDRGVDLGKRLIFDNNINGFERLMSWLSEHMETHDKTKIILGVEPTGHYWLNLAYFAKAREIPFVVVNPMHTKKWKELDDNSPSKNDTKDARVIGQLVKDGRYSIPNLLEGVYAELRQGMKRRDQLSQDLQKVSGRIDNWLDRYFPEFKIVFKDWSGKAAMCSLKHFPLPSEVTAKTAFTIVDEWKQEVKRAVGLKKAEQLIEAAKRSACLTVGLKMAKREVEDLINQYRSLQEKVKLVDQDIEELLKDTLQPKK